MSAFMVDPGHIDFLVNAIRSFDIRMAYIPSAKEDGDLDEIDLRSMSDTDLGKTLLGTNLTSMKERYGDSLSEDELSAMDRYEYQRPPLPLEPVQILKAVRCYQYQCCEYPGWKDSLARDIVDRVTAHAISALPTYRSAQWEISRVYADTPTSGS